jgi:hypothetical protein
VAAQKAFVTANFNWQVMFYNPPIKIGGYTGNTRHTGHPIRGKTHRQTDFFKTIQT